MSSDELDLKMDMIQNQSSTQIQKSSKLFKVAAKKLEEAYQELVKTTDMLNNLRFELDEVKSELQNRERAVKAAELAAAIRDRGSVSQGMMKTMMLIRLRC
jgi:hypothetical protein